MLRYPELFEAVTRTLTYCEVRPHEQVVIYSDSGRRREIADAFVAGAVALGCDPILLWGKARPRMVAPPAVVIEAMKRADVVFEISAESWLYTEATQEILESGTRMLQVRYDQRLLERAPTDTIVRKSQAARRLFEQATTIRLKSDLGTEFTVGYRGRPPVAQDGAVVRPGEWDSAGTAYCNVFPHEETAEGTIVLNGPVLSTPTLKFIIDHPVTLKIHQGHVTSVEGGREAQRLRDWFDGQGDSDLRRISHIGVGLDPRCGPPPKPAETGDYGAWEAMNGGVIVAFGASQGLGARGGQNRATNHIDCVVLECDFTLDETPLVKRGTFVASGLTEGSTG